MGGRGSSGVTSMSSRKSSEWRIPDLSGSEKQVKYATDIINNAMQTFRTMDKNIESEFKKIKKYPKAGFTEQELARQLGYDKKAVDSARKIVQQTIDSGNKSAGTIIDRRAHISSGSVTKLAKDLYRDQMEYDTKTKKIVKRERKK